MDKESVISVLEDTKQSSNRCLEFLTEEDASYYTFKERSEALDMAIAALREQEQKPMTNAQRIRAMTDEELADECDEKVRTYDLPKEVREIWMSEKMKLRDAWLKWLQQPCEAVQPITERPDGQS